MRRIVLVTFVIMLALSGCMNKPDILYIGEVRDQIASFPLHFTISAEFFPEEKIQFRTYSTEEKLFQALKKGSVDLAALPAVWSMLDDSGATAIIGPLQRAGGGIVTSKKIESLDELHGASIGVITSSQLADLSQALNGKENLGWDILLYPSEKKMIKAFKDGKIEAFAATTPNIAGYASSLNVIRWFSEDFQFYPAFSTLANMTSLEQKQAMIEDFLKQMNNAITLINLRPNDTYTNFSRICNILERYARDVLLQTRYITDSFPTDEQFENLMKDLAAARRSIPNPRSYRQALVR